MMMTDPIADFFTRIRNGVMVRHEKVDIPHSRIKARIAEILRDEGYIRNFKVFKDDKQGVLRVYLKYREEDPVLHGIQRVSKPGRRRYVKRDQVPKVLNGLGTALISTSAGVFTDQECREKGVGGEVLGYIW
ncbi:MAG: 30S ribosomal protein S8 [Nitrospinaceae bacterium]|nr:30S ribosomal protein S8 [Nitrospinaceae bacterium]NIR57637.1 30S ribosomal protein S8 [Nitrospinaceae bacterium]NIS88111.1 30S ribosomal protein S8 [Nitrospinaceae bacterium]NIT84975.1 30S ribosomal protein S8 [Nitrospinaceae bacterium]NIU47147.1 30S ribosomal protein S8 [Nitrospinaceae bacterium]